MGEAPLHQELSLVAVASVWNLYWHQTRPLEMRASMNLMAVPRINSSLPASCFGLVGSGVGVRVLTTSRGSSVSEA